MPLYRIRVTLHATVELRAPSEEDALAAVGRLCPAALPVAVEVRPDNGPMAGDKLASVDARPMEGGH